MPRKASRPCPRAGCPCLAPCPVHPPGDRARAFDQQRGTAAERGYDAAWRRVSEQVLHPASGPYLDTQGRPTAACADCAAKGRGVMATKAGHNRPANQGGTPTLDNARPLCTSCNTRQWHRDRWHAKQGAGGARG